MWPETEQKLEAQMRNVADRASAYGRTIDYGLRIHVIVRDTEEEARAAAKKLMSKLDIDLGKEIRERAQDAKSLGVARQASMRDISDEDGFAEDILWTGIGQARSG